MTEVDSLNVHEIRPSKEGATDMSAKDKSKDSSPQFQQQKAAVVDMEICLDMEYGQHS